MSTTETYRPDWLGGPPPQTHVRLDGAGEARWFVGMLAVIKSRPEETAGDWLFGPREVPHRFEVGPNGARMFWTLTPGGFDRFVVAASEPAPELAPPPGFAPDEAYLAWLTQVAADHAITLHL